MINGKLVNFDDKPAKGKNGPRMCIDINGEGNPNTVGLDIFYFLFTTDGHIIPEGQDHETNNYDGGAAWEAGTVKAAPEYCSGSAYNGSLACTYYAVNDISPDGDGTYWGKFIKKF